MLLIAPSSFCCPPTKLFEKYSRNPKISLLPTYEKKKLKSRNGWKLGVSYGYPYFTSPRHPLESELKSETTPEADNNGIGIDDFYRGKKICITGATGFVGKALVEKLLRSTFVEKIYLLMKANDKDAAIDRLLTEIVYSDLFQILRKENKGSYEKFAQEKLIPVVGNICEPNLGMDTKSAQLIMDEVDVIMALAATTTLNARYDTLLLENTIAPQRLLRFAKRCKKLKLFVHMSTAYVSGKQEGIIYETPWVMGENARKRDDHEISSCMFQPLDLFEEVNLAMKSCMASSEYEATRNLRRLGQERAAFYGWNNTYHLTKAMGEMVLEESRGDVPVLIIRPSVIEGSYKEPILGWVEGNSDYFLCGGLLPGYLADPEAHVDIVPIDMVVNITIVAAAKHGIISRPGLQVYHATTDFMNPLQYSNFFDYIHEHFKKYPSTKSKNLKKIRFFGEFNDFSKYIREELSKASGMGHVVGMNGKLTQSSIQKQYKAKVMYVEQLCKLYEFVGFFKARFHTGNTRRLLEEMSANERRNFEVDATKIDWRKYLIETHIPGLRKHVLNETIVSI